MREGILKAKPGFVNEWALVKLPPTRFLNVSGGLGVRSARRPEVRTAPGFQPAAGGSSFGQVKTS
jgi:hypothetical protein